MASAAALSDADALLEESLEEEEEEEEEEEDEDEPDEPELEDVEADDDAVEDDASPELSVVVCEAVSQAATKKATATSAIRRCNMVMLPGLFRFNMHPGYRIMVPARPVNYSRPTVVWDMPTPVRKSKNRLTSTTHDYASALILVTYYPKTPLKGNKKRVFPQA